MLTYFLTTSSPCFLLVSPFGFFRPVPFAAFSVFGCPILQNRTRGIPKHASACPIHQKRTSKTTKRMFECSFLQNRTSLHRTKGTDRDC
ncbi:hypothetical protein BIFPSEUDO_04056 [Bifidobacterium pseudocatenulatum DSM 20438 = JCM 1200 = LMG 10505]|uniref:Uncharacterized protein n=1 Tax=Bifidobacterium pseudocatenulatum DSM 20438 = JCM 1200 = LMG 10505 TaxID=547043 RepID=C0BUH0_BIFPS|nr:hypothetical protein BIFPSEUDO_04056 [Bifidobacterium pseudocatenulatum DSM 20438 = JCM 1200 = LMG 10505]